MFYTQSAVCSPRFIPTGDGNAGVGAERVDGSADVGAERNSKDKSAHVIAEIVFIEV